MKEQIIVAESKTTTLRIRVSYTDKHVTRGQVLRGDAFNRIGAVDYWSTSTLNIITDEHKVNTDPIVQQVVESFHNRSKVGIKKYGTTLEENNTDDFYQHLSEELMDSLLYLQKLKTIKPCLEDFSMSEIVEYIRENGYKVKYKL
jgi:hypothetical protein